MKLPAITEDHWKIIVVIFALLITAAWFLTADHWWKKVSSATVTYDGQLSSHAGIYRSRDGDLLVDLRGHGESLYEVHYFKHSKGGKWLVGRTNAGNFHFLPGYALSENAPPPTVDMGGVKDEADPKLIVEENSIEFTSHKRVRVRVSR